jgi:hypothetical protein
MRQWPDTLPQHTTKHNLRMYIQTQTESLTRMKLSGFRYEPVVFDAENMPRVVQRGSSNRPCFYRTETEDAISGMFDCCTKGTQIWR